MILKINLLRVCNKYVDLYNDKGILSNRYFCRLCANQDSKFSTFIKTSILMKVSIQ